MGRITPHKPALLFMAAFSRHEPALAWARRRAEEAFGPIALASDVFAFDQTDYYTAEMGSELLKTFFAFERPFDPAELPGVKHRTNRWEDAYRQECPSRETRPLNLDPGYLTEAKLVLATTKDRDHRIYLADGIFAEVTLYYRAKKWQAREWTYADYRQDAYHAFLNECRQDLRTRQRKGKERSEGS